MHYRKETFLFIKQTLDAGLIKQLGTDVKFILAQ